MHWEAAKRKADAKVRPSTYVGARRSVRGEMLKAIRAP